MGGGGGGSPPPERAGSATAEGVGADFEFETFPPTRMPEVEYRRPRPGAEMPAGTAGEPGPRAVEGEPPVRPPDAEVAGRPPETTNLTPDEADLLADAIDSGDLTDLPPHLRRRAEIAETHAEASGRSYEGEQAPADRGEVDRPRSGTEVPADPLNLPEIQEAALSAQAALADLPPGPGAKTVGGIEGSPSTTSGSAGDKIDTVERARELAVEAGAVREHIFDRMTGGPGYYHGSHAEIQTITRHPGRPVAVSKPMCGGCQDFFRRHAAVTRQRIVVADPDCVRVFLEDGSVHESSHGDLRGRDLSTSGLPDPPRGAPVGRSR